MDSRICIVDGCGKEHHAKGFCKSHYLRNRRHGDPLSGGTYLGEPWEWLNKSLKIVTEDCIYWPYGTNGAGYAAVMVDGKYTLVHRIVCSLVNGDPADDKQLALHSCHGGKLGCINGKHLRWGTNQENSDDMVTAGRSLKGISRPFKRLKPSDVRLIRARLSNGEKKVSIARSFGVTSLSIRNIEKGKSWSRLR